MFLVIVILSLFVFYILGKLGVKLIRHPLYWTDSLFLGIILYTFIVSFIQIFLPLNIFIPIIIFLLSLLYYLHLNNKRSDSKQRIEPKKIIMFLLLSLLLYPFWKVLPKAYDHYLYHDQVISWFNTYKLNWGLGNLHGRFAFNNSLFPTIASFQLDYKSNWYFFNIFLFVLFLFKLNNFRSLNNTILTQIGTSIYALGVFIYGLPYFSGVSPDFQIVIFVSVVLLNFIQYTEGKGSRIYLVLLCTFSVTVKLNFAPLLLSIATIVLFKDYKITKKLDFKLYLLPSIFISIWMVRSIIISGQIVYPFPPLHTEVFKHSVSEKQVVNELIAVTGWAQSPGKGYRESYLLNKGTLNWFPKWYKERFNHTYSRFPGIGKISISAFAIISLLSGILMLFYFITARNIELAFLVLALLTNIVYWFMTGPDYRFGFLNFLILMLLPLLINIQMKIVNVLVLLFTILTVPFQIMFSFKIGLKTYKKAYRTQNISDKGNENGLNNGSLDQMKLLFITNGSDTFYYYNPSIGDQIPQNVFPGLAGDLSNVTLRKDGDAFIFSRRETQKP